MENTLKQYPFNININVTDVNLIDITQQIIIQYNKNFQSAKIIVSIKRMLVVF
jgi:hypothetical protein